MNSAKGSERDMGGEVRDDFLNQICKLRGGGRNLGHAESYRKQRLYGIGSVQKSLFSGGDLCQP